MRPYRRRRRYVGRDDPEYTLGVGGPGGLVEWWPLNETSGVRTGAASGIVLTDNNTVLSGGGVGSYALALDGTSQYLEVAGIDTGITTKATISVWAYQLAGTTNDTIIDILDAAGDRLAILAGAAATTASLYAYDGANGNATRANALAASEWRHHYIEYDGGGAADADRLKYWVNGVSQALTFVSAIPATMVLNNCTITVGFDTAHTAGYYWSGRVQNFGLWASTGSTTAAEQYASGRGLRYSQLTTAQKVGMFDLWELGEASGNRVGSYAATALAPANAPGRLAGIVNSSKTSTGANFVRTNTEYLSTLGTSLRLGNVSKTVVAWVNPSTTPDAGGTDPIAIQWGPGNLGYGLAIQNGTGKFAFQIGAGDGGAGTDSVVWTPAPTLGEWYCVIGWYDAAAGKEYIQVNDGTPVEDTVSVAGGVGQSTVSFKIGGGVAALYYVNAAIDEVAVFARVLTAAERTYLYNSGAGRTYSGGLIL